MALRALQRALAGRRRGPRGSGISAVEEERRELHAFDESDARYRQPTLSKRGTQAIWLCLPAYTLCRADGVRICGRNKRSVVIRCRPAGMIEAERWEAAVTTAQGGRDAR